MYKQLHVFASIEVSCFLFVSLQVMVFENLFVFRPVSEEVTELLLRLIRDAQMEVGRWRAGRGRNNLQKKEEKKAHWIHAPETATELSHYCQRAMEASSSLSHCLLTNSYPRLFSSDWSLQAVSAPALLELFQSTLTLLVNALYTTSPNKTLNEP